MFILTRDCTKVKSSELKRVLIDSPKPGHIKSHYRSAAKETVDYHQVQG